MDDQEKEKLEETCLSYRDDILRYIISRVKNVDDAKDLTQTTFEKVLRSIKGGKEIRLLRAYIFRVAGNVINDYFEEEGKKTRAVIKNFIDIDDELSSDSSLDIESNDPSIVNLLLMKEAISSLDDITRRIVIYRVFQGLSYEEISTIMNFPLRNIGYRFRKGVSKIRGHLIGEF